MGWRQRDPNVARHTPLRFESRGSAPLDLIECFTNIHNEMKRHKGDKTQSPTGLLCIGELDWLYEWNDGPDAYGEIPCGFQLVGKIHDVTRESAQCMQLVFIARAEPYTHILQISLTKSLCKHCMLVNRSSAQGGMTERLIIL